MKKEILSIILSKRKFFYLKETNKNTIELETVNSNQQIRFINNQKELVVTNNRFKIQYWHLQDLVETINDLNEDFYKLH